MEWKRDPIICWKNVKSSGILCRLFDVIVSRGNIHAKNAMDNVIFTFEGEWENLPHVIIVTIFVFKN